MSHEVLITRRQSIFWFFCKSRQRGASASQPASTSQHQPAPTFWGPPLPGFGKKIKNALSSGYQDLMGHLILTTSPWSVLTWITLIRTGPIICTVCEIFFNFTSRYFFYYMKNWIFWKNKWNTFIRTVQSKKFGLQHFTVVPLYSRPVMISLLHDLMVLLVN